MPLRPAFDYYAELKVERKATHHDITSSYRRLALLHHPDRNPKDPAAATAKFQRVSSFHFHLTSLHFVALPLTSYLAPSPPPPRSVVQDLYLPQIQEAYEHLMDPSKRATYDRSANPANARPEFPNGRYSGYQSDEDDLSPARESPRRPYEEPPQPMPGFTRDGRGGFSGGPGYYDDYANIFDSHFAKKRRNFQQQSQREEHSKYHLELSLLDNDFVERTLIANDTETVERIMREAEQRRREAERRARQSRAKAEADERGREVERRAARERHAQQMRWMEAGAATLAAKQSTCLHSKFHWPRLDLMQKLPCPTCGVKRGVFGFRCPHCSLVVCQLCRDKLSEKIRKMERT
jgi:curved DNA-binding protein CbpA